MHVYLDTMDRPEETTAAAKDLPSAARTEAATKLQSAQRGSAIRRQKKLCQKEAQRARAATKLLDYFGAHCSERVSDGRGRCLHDGTVVRSSACPSILAGALRSP